MMNYGLTIQSHLCWFRSHEGSINMYSSIIYLIVCSQLCRKQSCLFLCVFRSFTSFCQKAVAPLPITYRSACMLLSPCKLCFVVGLVSFWLAFFFLGGRGVFKINLHHSFLPVSRKDGLPPHPPFRYLMLFHLFSYTSIKFIFPSLSFVFQVHYFSF